MRPSLPTDQPKALPSRKLERLRYKQAIRHQRQLQRKQFILKGTSVLPTMCTLANGLCGFGAIHFATRDGLGYAGLANMEIACWLIFLAMVCDMLDGRLARWTRTTTDFGAQLDSLSDAISFGVAPAVLMLRTVISVMQGHVEKLAFMPSLPVLERVVWCVAAAYVACAIIRLARFNVETDADESAHMHFTGLPSPGAAAAVAAVILLLVRLAQIDTGWKSSPILLGAVAIVLPVATLAVALLMVSRFRYPHVVNKFIRGKKSIGHILKLLAIALAAIPEPFIMAAVLTLAFAVSGPLGAVRNWFGRKPAGVAMEQPADTVESHPHKGRG